MLNKVFFDLAKVAKIVGKVFNKEVSIYFGEDAVPVAFVSIFSNGNRSLSVYIEPICDRDGETFTGNYLVIVEESQWLWNEVISKRVATDLEFWQRVKEAVESALI